MSDASGKIVLIVDDDPLIREVIGQFVGTRRHQVLEAEGGQQALDLLATGCHVDLIILDVMMPGMDGFETLSKIRDRGLSLPVVMLTARSQDEDVMRGYSAGADFYLVKPVSIETLRKVVDYLIGDLSDEERAQIESEI